MADAYTYDYVAPDFLQGQSADEIHMRMLASLPSDITKEEGSIPWDFTRPSALEKAEFVEFTLNETIKLLFPQWSYGRWLDLHGERENCARRAANKASGTLDVTGVAGTVIPPGYQFATPAGLTASVLFETLESHVLEGTPDAGGMVTNEIAIQAVTGGVSGNVAAGTVKLMVSPINGIRLVTNPEAMTGGTEEEEDADYLVRILEKVRSGASMTGCNADYRRWAKEVAAVGECIVEPEWNDPDLPAAWRYTDTAGNAHCAGAVRLIIVDSNGEPANSQILEAVYGHIAGTGAEDPERLMPIGAHLTVQAPTAVTVSVAATVILADGEDIGTVTGRFRQALAEYWLEVAEEAADDAAGRMGYVRYVQIGAALAKTSGVVDYTGLTANGGTANIAISMGEYPVTGEVALNVQT
ncbi:MAG: baseplate J/gp47 family protein [Oscillospiraceae bacterium]|nr:baseplate J/gp47 family protein [Oscillospiraceae bacterium]